MINRKRIVAVLLAFLMIFEMLPVTAVAEGWAMLMSNVLTGDTYHTVTFSVDGTQIASQYVKAGENPVIPENPTKAEDRENNKAYVFTGWYDGDTQITANTAVNSDVNAVAKFDTIGLYQVTIKYLIDTDEDENFEPAANTVVRWYTTLDGQEVIQSPTNVLEGTLDDTYIPNQDSVVINPAELTANKEIIVTYHTTDTTYTIYHQVRNPHYGEGDTDEPEYTLLGTTQGHGLIGQTVSARGLTPEEFMEEFDRDCHYNYVSSTSTVLTGNEAEDYVIVVYEPHLHVLSYDSQGGSYIDPVTKHCHETVTVYSEIVDNVQIGTNIICGKTEHTHSRWCGGSYYCSLEEHTHSDECEEAVTEQRITWTPTPTRQGYIFGGWYLDAACTQEAPETMILSENTVVYAKWLPGQADYTVVYWAENVEAEGLYNYIGSVAHTGTVGETVSAGAATFNSSVFANQQYYHFDSSKTEPAEVKADGTAVVNAYFMLNEYNLTFNFSNVDSNNVVLTMGGTQYTRNGTQYTFKAKYGQDISKLWPTGGDFSHKTNTSWDNNFYGWIMEGSRTVYASKRLVLSADMIASTNNGSTTTYNSTWGAKNKFELHYMLQNTDDNRYTDSPDYRQHNALSDSEGYNQKDIAGFKKETSHDDNGDVVVGEDGLKHIYFYYTRETYNVDYYYGSKLLNSLSNVRFGKNLSNSTYNWTPTTVQAGLMPEYTFAGWYDNIACEGAPYFNTIGTNGNVITRTMPAGNLVLYAKFLPPDRTITLKNSDGTAIVDENGKPIVVTVTYGETPEISTPVREGYTFMGWYTAPDGGTLYDTEKPLTDNITIYAHWQLKTISLTIRYWTLGSTETNYTEVRDNRSWASDALKPGEQYILHAQYVDGYRPTKATQPIVLTVGDNYATFYYVERKPVNYTVKYVLESDPSVAIKDSKTTLAPIDVSRVSEIAPALLTYDGQDYYPTVKAESLVLSADETQNVITFYYCPYKTANVEVRYWYPKADGTGYEQRTDLTETVPAVRIADSVYAKDYQDKGEVGPYIFDKDKTTVVSVTVEAKDAGTTLVLDLYYKLGLTTMTIEKKVVDNTTDANASKSLVFLFEVNDGTKTQTVEVPANGSATVNDLVIGKAVTVTETGVKGQGANALNAWTIEAAKMITLGADAASNKVTFTNTRKVAGGTEGVTATKTWSGTPASSAELQLMRNGEAYGAPVAVQADNWSYTWQNLPEYDLAGAKYTYTVTESGAANGQIKLDNYLYDVTESELNVTNKQVTGQITVALSDKTVVYTGSEQSLDAPSITGGPEGLTLADLKGSVSGGKGTDVDVYPGTVSGDATYLAEDGTLYAVTYINAELTITGLKVEHYLQQLDKTFKLDADASAIVGVPAGTHYAETYVKNYEGYTYDPTAEDSVTSVVVANDGEMPVLKLYYTRDMLILTLGKDVVDTTKDAPAADATFAITYTYVVDGQTITDTVKLADNQTKQIPLPTGGKLTVTENADPNVWDITGTVTDLELNASQAVTITNTRKLFDPDGPNGEDPLGEVHVIKLWRDKDNVTLNEMYIPEGNVGIELLRSNGGEAMVYDSVALSRNKRVHTFKNLPAYDLAGHKYVYSVKEVGTENGHVVHNGYRYTVSGDGVVTKGVQTIVNTLDLVDVVVTKKWVLNGIQLTFKPELKMTLTAGGVEYGVLRAADQTVTPTSVDTYTFKNVPYRTDYQVVEELIGHGKALINGKETNIHGTFDEKQTANVKLDAQGNFTAEITNTAKNAAITVKKTVDLNGLKVTIPEFTFTVTVNGESQKVTLQPTEDNLTVSKQVLIPVPTGDVIVTETAVTGWTADTTSVKLTEEQIVGQNKPVTASFTNTRDRLPLVDGTTVTITKQIVTENLTSDMAEELFDFVVTVPSDLKNGTEVTYKIDNGPDVTVEVNGSFIVKGVKNGQTVTVTSGLPTGDYSVREEQDKQNHHLYEATVTKDGYNFLAKNKAVVGSLIVEKRWEHPNGEVDSAFAYGANGQAVTTFGLYKNAQDTEPVVKVKTNANGDAIFETLNPGTYYVKELEVENADNYSVSGDILKVEVVANATIPAAYTFTNKLKRTTEEAGRIDIAKVVNWQGVKKEATSFTIAYRYVLTDNSAARQIVTGTIKANVAANGTITYDGDTTLTDLPYGTIVTVTETFEGQAGDAWTTTIGKATTRTTNVVAGAQNQTVTITNTRKLRDNDGVLNVTKEWIDANNADELRPKLAEYVKLYNHVHGETWAPSTYGEQQINEAQTEIKYINLPAYDLTGKLLTYAVKEDAMDHYVADPAGYVLDGGKIVNTLYTDLTVTKVWKNAYDKVIPGARDVQADVLRGNKTVATVKLTVDGLQNKVSVPKYDAAGNAYDYTIKEIGEADGVLMIGDMKYTVKYDETDDYNFTITNTKQNVEKTSVSEAGMTVQVKDEEGNIIDLVKVGGKITYSIRFGNYTYKEATVTLRDTLPVGLQFVPDESTPGAQVETLSDGRTKVTWSKEKVAPRTRGTVTLVAIVTEAALAGNVPNPVLSNTATITVGDVTEDTTTAVETIYNPDWTVDKKITNQGTGENGAFKAGDTIEYAITVENTGNVDLTTLKVVDTFTVDGVEKTLVLSNEKLNPAAFALKVGETAVFTASYEIQANDKHIVNAVVVEDGDDDTKDPEDEVETDVDKNPKWEVVKAVTNKGTGKEGAFLPGEVVKYSITVTNIGNVDLMDMSLTDTINVDGEKATLAVNEAELAKRFDLKKGASITFTAQYTVNATDNTIINFATATYGDKPEDSDEVVTDVEPTPAWKTEKKVVSVDADNDGKYAPDETIEYEIIVTNTGNTKLEGLKLEDLLTVDNKAAELTEGLKDKDGNADPASFTLEKGASETFTASYKVKATDNKVSNTAIASIGEKEEPSDPVPTDVEDKPAWTVTKVSAEDTYKVGDKVTYTITVKNTGNTTLELTLKDVFTVDGEKVTLKLNGALNPESFELKEGEEAVFTATYEVEANDTELHNVAIVSDGSDERSDDETDKVEAKPAWTVEKKADKERYAVGETVEYTITVTNTGNVTLEHLNIEDTFTVDGKVPEQQLTLTNENNLDSNDFVLAKGATAIFTATYIVQETDSKLVNAVVVHNGDKEPDDPKDEVITPVDDKPAWTVVKEITSKGSGENGKYLPGEVVKYSITVSNTGNVILQGMNLTDTITVDGKEMTLALTHETEKAYRFNLDKGASITFTAEYTIAPADNEITNIATAKHGDTPVDSNEVKTEVEPTPAWTVDKEVTNEGTGTNKRFKVGDTVQYKITVTNIGNCDLPTMSLIDLFEVDSLKADLTLANADGLNPDDFELKEGKSAVFTASYKLEDDDSLLINKVTASDNDPTTDPDPKDEERTEIDRNPKWTVDKTVDKETCKVGETVTYTIAVKNTGNVYLPKLSIVDTFLVDGEMVELELTNARGLNPVSFGLAKGATVYFTATYTAQQTDSELVNVVVVKDDDKKTEDPEDEVVTKVDPNPDWTVEKVVSNKGTGKDGAFKVGEVVEYTITVKNTGNVDLTGLVLTDMIEIDDKAPAALEVPAEGNSFDLEKHGVKTFKVTYTVQPTDKTLVNTAIVTGDGDEKKDPTDPEEIEPNPDWTVTKTVVNTGSGENGAFRTGDTIKYEITVKNIGNVDLTDLTLEDIFTVDGEIKQLTLAPAAEKFSIAKHGSVTFTSSYTIQATDNVLVNTAKVGDEESEIITEIEDCPNYTIDKTVTNTGSGENGAFKAGDTVIYKIVVVNTGNTDLKGLSVKETFTVDGVAKDIVLKPDASSFDLAEGKSAEFYAEYKVLKTDLQLRNAAVVNGDEGDREDEVITDLEPNPAVTVKKEVINNGSGKNYQFMVGDKIRYRVTVTNVGNVDLKDLTLEDTFKVDGWTKELKLPEEAAKFDLAKGETIVFNYSYVVREGDQRVVNVATVMDTTDKVTINVTDDPAASAEIPPAVGYTYNVGDCFD